MTSHFARNSDALAALLSDGPAADQAAHLGPFRNLIGDWHLDITDIADGSQRSFHGTWHFFWGLGGRAILDVWKVPGREQGITVRFYDPKIEALRSTWIAPNGGLVMPFIGRYIDEELILEHVGDAGLRSRWTFSDVKESSFKWRGERSEDGLHWILEQTMVAERIYA